MNNWENKYNLNILCPLVFECDFPQSNLLQKYRDDIIINYASNILSQLQRKGGNSIIYTNKEVLPLIKKQYLDIINYYFEVPSLKKEIEMWTYIQTKDRSINEVHNHYSQSDISTTFYLDVPKEGGELRFFIDGDVFEIKPEPNKLYMFPSWLYHQPLPHKDHITRICINVDLFFGVRPKVKIPFNEYKENENWIKKSIFNNEYFW